MLLNGATENHLEIVSLNPKSATTIHVWESKKAKLAINFGY